MNDMRAVIVPKSDQINADDLIGGPRTITISGVDIKASAEQPVSISFEGDNGKPWRPCKSMSRVLVNMWGPDAKAYVGRSLTLYRDPKVKWGGLEVGGIRISHMSDIEQAHTMALTETRANRKPFTVRPLANAPAATPNDGRVKAEQWLAGYLADPSEGVTTDRALAKLKREYPDLYERAIDADQQTAAAGPSPADAAETSTEAPEAAADASTPEYTLEQAKGMIDKAVGAAAINSAVAELLPMVAEADRDALQSHAAVRIHEAGQVQEGLV